MYQNYLNQNFQVLERGVGLSTHSDSELITQALCLNPPEGEVKSEFNWFWLGFVRFRNWGIVIKTRLFVSIAG